MSFLPGQVVGEYRIIEQLGSGAFGSVFRVEHTVTNRQEAMKVLGATAPATEEQRRRFLREIQLQARLSHPNIAAVHNAFWFEESMVMIMELVDGESLQQILDRGRPPRMEGIGYIVQVLTALTYSHSQGIVHRDVSPANIILTRAGTVKLTDFGLAKAPFDSRVTATGALIGSPFYMSPEQVRGIDRIDPRTDIYSCGVILYEVLTGHKLFDYESAFSLMRAHLEEEPRPPMELDPGIPRAVNDAVLRALSKDPRARFPSAETFRNVLQRVISPAAPPVPAARPAPQPPPPRSPRNWASWRQPAQWAAAALSGIVMAFLLMFGLRWASTGLLPDLPAPPEVPPRAQQAAGRVIHNIRHMVENAAVGREFPALPWSAAESPPVESPVKAPPPPKAPAPEPVRAARERRQRPLLAPPEMPPPRPLESILQILARMPVMLPPPAEPPAAPDEEGDRQPELAGPPVPAREEP